MGLVFVAKTLLTALVIAGFSELAKRSNYLAAVLISLPLMSIIGFIWVYIESKDVAKIQTLSYEVLFLIIPSLLFFICLPYCLKAGLNFWFALVVSIIITTLGYLLYTKVFRLWA